MNSENYFKDNELAYSAWVSKYQHGNESLQEFFLRIANEFGRLDNFNIDLANLPAEKYNDLSEYGKSRFSTLDKSKLFYDLFKDFGYIIPGGSILAGVGSGKPVSLSNCFVTDTGDSIEEIFNTARNMSEVYKRRGGNGTDLSTLRPSGAAVNNAAKTTGGVVPFMELLSQVTNTIGQDGRRGALMLSLDIRHPDSPAFTVIKQDLTKVTGANVSLRIYNDFMNAVENDEDYILRWPVDLIERYSAHEIMEINMLADVPYNTLFPFILEGKTVGYTKKIRAKELWDSIVHCAWKTAEPGILFWDNVLDNDPASVYKEFKAVSTNPCGEIPLSPYDSCRLIATNLYSLVKHPFEVRARIDYHLAYNIFYEAQIIADILVDLEIEAIDRIIGITKNQEQAFWKKVNEIGKSGRRTGTGLTGLGDMLAALNLDYTNSGILEDIMKLKMKAELDATIDLAIIHGSFPSYNRDLEYTFFGVDERIVLKDPYNYDMLPQNQFFENLLEMFPEQVHKMLKYGRRNVSWSTIAPTGTISIMAGVSSGCEPTFSIYYTRRKKCNPGEIADFTDQNGVGFKNFNVLHDKFKTWYEYIGKNPEDLYTMPTDELDELITTSPWHHNTAEEIDPTTRVLVQSLLQRYTTHSISSTVNVANNVPESYISTIYTEAFVHGLKGITVYRDGSRSGILVKSEQLSNELTKRPSEIECLVQQFKNEKKDWVAFIGLLNNYPYEIFTGPKDMDVFPIPSSVEKGQIIKLKETDGTSRYDFRYIDSYGYTNTLGGLSRIFDKEYWNYARFVSALLRSKVPIEQVIKVVEGLSFTNKGMNNWKSGVTRALSPFVADGTIVQGAVCENCNSTNIIYEGGCMVCRNCGSSKCG